MIKSVLEAAGRKVRMIGTNGIYYMRRHKETANTTPESYDLQKPFRVAELRARVAAHLRRQNRTPAHRLVRGGVAFDLSAKSAAVGETPLPLTRSEYAICEYLALYAGQTFTTEQIYEAVFGIDGTADDTAVTQHIKNIRAKLRAAGVPEPEKLLNTVWGVGYRWKSED
ncbi:hypothetical protein CGS50_012540 [Faecalibacterium prausnitzii]|uniref:OmpR/PhoB-type domain-containing protein n=2 Tax=Faecalibacterium prausnitzii TaxID=853 RepID=A0A2J4JL55_9FIRM|nr:hypothetical protein CGS50_012540 [Faecalibacterium prausnitzii]